MESEISVARLSVRRFIFYGTALQFLSIEEPGDNATRSRRRFRRLAGHSKIGKGVLVVARVFKRGICEKDRGISPGQGESSDSRIGTLSDISEPT